MPAETSDMPLNASVALKRALVARMQVPEVGATATITGIESFLGFRDGQSKAWMRRLLNTASTVSRFFPGSTNLSTIGTSTQEEIISPMHWNVADARTATDHKWYRGRNSWTYSFKGVVNTESSGTLYKVAASASPHSIYDANIFPAVIPALAKSAGQDGPYFDNPVGSVSVPLSLVEAQDQPDPIRNARTLLEDTLYDNLAGRSRS